MRTRLQKPCHALKMPTLGCTQQRGGAVTVQGIIDEGHPRPRDKLAEGGGIADVLFRTASGNINHDFEGRLSFSWPKRADQYALNVGDPDYDPLFPFGYGLSYGDNVRMAGDLPTTLGDERLVAPVTRARESCVD